MAEKKNKSNFFYNIEMTITLILLDGKFPRIPSWTREKVIGATVHKAG
jgi:hypothetical protein